MCSTGGSRGQRSMFDFHTLFVVTMFISGLAGLLLLLAWRQNPTIMALGLWGSAFLMSAASMCC